MTTNVLHSQIQQGRFLDHLLASLGALFKAAPRDASAQAPVANASLDAQKVRELAYQYADTDPGFSADLYAAAARHEGLAGD